MNTVLDTSKDYQKLAYSFTETVLRPGGEQLTTYSWPIEYTATGYLPFVSGSYTDESGNTFSCRYVPLAALPLTFSNLVVDIFTNGNTVYADVHGDSSDPDDYTAELEVNVFMLSHD